jgi:3-isopropylmalate/(R)-2-methylmalate dehydratase small subunit
VVAPSFGDIFASNAAQIGLVTIALPEEQVYGLMEARKLTVDLEAQTITDQYGHTVAFEFDPFRRHKLLNGLDDVGLTLEHEDEIAAFEASSPVRVDTTELPV